ncbi:MAG: isoaspartyl peptidase/L-asparaginase [Rhodobacteraceae bacterium]|nr:isoaspartyl peptidase/L-asparaginase [Paracoccaceae bacterium]
MPYALVIHGGAGAQPGTDYSAQAEHMAKLIARGQEMLADGENALAVVAGMVAELEASGLYVAGKGSGPNAAGEFELDASIMDGRNRNSGAVAGIRGFIHPVLAARAVMEDGRHVMLAGAGAEELARSAGLAEVEDPQAYYSEHVRHGSADTVNHGTVGAVALDRSGALAAATSTGGTFGKLPGRLGDTPVIGAGTWADNLVAVSSTGLGEAFIRCAAAHDVAARMHYGGRDLGTATREVLDEVRKCGGDGGLIAVDAQGRISMPYNSQGMKRAAVSYATDAVVRVFEPEP